MPYATDDEALDDVLRLSRGMTYKAAVAGLDLGGGKAVIIGDPATDPHRGAASGPTAASSTAWAGATSRPRTSAPPRPTWTSSGDETAYVTGRQPRRWRLGRPVAATAYGVLHAMQAVAAHLWGDADLEGRHVVVNGVGKVGSALVAPPGRGAGAA